MVKTLPKSALACGADLVAQSTHKLIGSLTQTSMLHGQDMLINERRITQVHQILQSTSPNYICAGIWEKNWRNVEFR